MFRISSATITICILAVLFGLGGAYALRIYLKEKPIAAAAPAPAPDATTVPVASLDLPAGRIITRGDIGLMLRRQMGELPPQTMASPEDIIGRVLREPIKTGSTFQTTSLFPEGTGPNLSEQLQQGLRAVTISVDRLGTLGGHVRPGSFVDVLFRATRKEDKDGFEEIPEMTVTLLQGVEVLAVGPDPISQKPEAVPTPAERQNPMVSVTLACSPEQSAKLRAVMGHGEIALAMLPDAKFEAAVKNTNPPPTPARPAGVTLENILGVDTQPKQVKTEIYRGGNRTTNVFNVRMRRATLLESITDAPQISPKPQIVIPPTATSVAGPAGAPDQE